MRSAVFFFLVTRHPEYVVHIRRDKFRYSKPFSEMIFTLRVLVLPEKARKSELQESQKNIIRNNQNDDKSTSL